MRYFVEVRFNGAKTYHTVDIPAATKTYSELVDYMSDGIEDFEIPELVGVGWYAEIATATSKRVLHVRRNRDVVQLMAPVEGVGAVSRKMIVERLSFSCIRQYIGNAGSRICPIWSIQST